MTTTAPRPRRARMTIPALVYAGMVAFNTFVLVIAKPADLLVVATVAGALALAVVVGAPMRVKVRIGAVVGLFLVAVAAPDPLGESSNYGFLVSWAIFWLFMFGFSIRRLVASFRSKEAPAAEDTPIDLDPYDVHPSKRIVGLSGYAGAGKDTAAKGLLWNGWHHASFAGPLKSVTLAINPLVPVHPGMRGYDTLVAAGARIEDGTGVMHVRLREYVDAAGGLELSKDNPEVRALLQRVGTDAGRAILGQDVWVDASMATLPEADVVFTDVRFPNEAQAIQDAGGYVIRIVREGHGPVNGHPSETALDDFPFDAIIHNDSTAREVGERLRRAVAILDRVAYAEETALV